MSEELYRLFRRNFPYVIRGEETVKEILSDKKNQILEKRNEAGELIGASVIHGNTVYLLCVDSGYRCRGLGNALLEETEDALRRAGHCEVRIGAGDGYLTPGIPTGIQPFREDLGPEALCVELIGSDPAAFFEKRGYRHVWGEANCFDMEAELPTLEISGCGLGDTIEGVLYRWAEPEDLPQVLTCVEEGEAGFTEFYRPDSLYREGGAQRALLAVTEKSVCGGILVGLETDGPQTGSLGCTVVSPPYRGRHIGVNLTLLGTKFLKDAGLKKGFIGYTYSGLQRLYGQAGYKISSYYYMASKNLQPE